MAISTFFLYASHLYRMLGKHAAKIQKTIPWPILGIFCCRMISEKPLCLEDTRRTQFSRLTTFNYQKLHVKLLKPREMFDMTSSSLYTIFFPDSFNLFVVFFQTPQDRF